MKLLPTFSCISLLLTLLCALPSQARDVPGSRFRSPDEVIPIYVVLEGDPAILTALAEGTPGAPDTVARVQKRLAELAAQHAALRAPLEQLGAQWIVDLRRLANVIQIRCQRRHLDAIRALPGVLRLDPVPIYGRRKASAVPAIGAPIAWGLDIPVHGSGVRVGIIDSGIDYEHADLGGSGAPEDYAQNDPEVVEEGSFPTARVTGGWDFVGDDYDATKPSKATPVSDPDPLDCQMPENMAVSGGHGTHVAGIAAGNGVLMDGSPYSGPYDQSLDPSAFRVYPGVAPEAELVALKIFGCDGSTELLAPALDLAADPDQDGDFTDRLDIVNASLGTSYGLHSPTEAQLVQNLTAAGTLLVVAAGNDGGTFYIAGAPGVHPQALSVAAIADADYRTLTIDAPESVAGDYIASEGGFTKPLVQVGKVSGTLVHTLPPLACSALTNAAELAGKVALIQRGSCLFAEKLERAEAAGAIAAVVYDDTYQPVPFSMGGGDGDGVGIPGVLIRRVDAETIAPALAGGVTLTLDPEKKFEGLGSELLMPFSSRGPSAISNLLKPELAAPGFSVDSARVGSGTEPRQSQGTSMASPFVAGAAALVRQAHPDMSPEEVKAALVGTAKPIQDLEEQPYPLSWGGSGRASVGDAVQTQLTARVLGAEGAVGISFGAIAAAELTSVVRSVEVRNHGSASITLSAEPIPLHALDGTTVTVSPGQVALPAGETAELLVTLQVDPVALGSPGPDPLTPKTQYNHARHSLTEVQGHLLLSPDPASNLPALRMPWYAPVRAASERLVAASPIGCLPDSVDTPILLELEGDSAHPEPFVTAFELGATHEKNPLAAGDAELATLDLLATGAATSAATAESWKEVSLSFGVVTSGEWTTAARGPLSRVGLAFDTDFDGEEDFATFVVPLSPWGPFADVLATMTFDLHSGQNKEPGRFINIVAADEHDSFPFNNNVLVLSVFAYQLDLEEDAPKFQYYAFTDDGEDGGEKTEWVAFDASRPVLDTSRGGSVDGRPIFLGDDPIVVHVDASAADGKPIESPLRLLVLHHTNVQGKRHEIIDLGGALPPATLSLTGKAPQSVATGEPFEVALHVKNEGPSTAHVALEGTSTHGLELLGGEPSQGSCQTGDPPSCDLGDMKPGSEADVTLTMAAPTAAAAVTLTATALSDTTCSEAPEDAQVQVVLEVHTQPAVVEPGPTPEPSPSVDTETFVERPEPSPPGPTGPTTTLAYATESDGCTSASRSQGSPAAPWLLGALLGLLCGAVRYGRRAANG